MTQLEQDLINDEGLRLKVYKDTVGKSTIGVGRDINDKPFRPEEVIKLGTSNERNVSTVEDLTNEIIANGITKDEAIYLLDNDIALVTKGLIHNLPWVDTQPDDVKRVLINMAFNMGVGGLLKFHNTLNFIKNNDYVDAANGMLASIWAKEVGARAIRLSDILKNIKNA